MRSFRILAVATDPVGTRRVPSHMEVDFPSKSKSLILREL